jgi:hypothetical protein
LQNFIQKDYCQERAEATIAGRTLWHVTQGLGKVGFSFQRGVNKARDTGWGRSGVKGTGCTGEKTMLYLETIYSLEGCLGYLAEDSQLFIFG